MPIDSFVFVPNSLDDLTESLREYVVDEECRGGMDDNKIIEDFSQHFQIDIMNSQEPASKTFSELQRHRKEMTETKENSDNQQHDSSILLFLLLYCHQTSLFFGSSQFTDNQHVGNEHDDKWNSVVEYDGYQNEIEHEVPPMFVRIQKFSFEIDLSFEVFDLEFEETSKIEDYSKDDDGCDRIGRCCVSTPNLNLQRSANCNPAFNSDQNHNIETACLGHHAQRIHVFSCIGDHKAFLFLSPNGQIHDTEKWKGENQKKYIRYR